MRLQGQGLFAGTKRDIEQIYSILMKYVSKRDAEVSSFGLNGLCSLIYKYIDVRRETFFGSSLVPAYDFSHDEIMGDINEKLLSLNDIAIKESDETIAKQIVSTYAQIAHKALEIKYRAGEGNPHATLAVGYMRMAIENCLKVEMDNVAINGFDQLGTLGLAALEKNQEMLVRSIVEDCYKISLYGLVKKNATYLFSGSLKAYSLFIHVSLFNIKVGGRFLDKMILERAKGVIVNFIALGETRSLSDTLHIQYALGDFIDLSNQNSMPYVYRKLINKFLDKKTPTDEKRRLIHSIDEFSDEVWQFYDELSKVAAKNESFLIHFIDSNIHEISESLLVLLKTDQTGEGEKQNIEKRIAWLLSVYWRMYDYHVQLTTIYQIQVLDNLLDLGTQLLEINNIRLLEDIIGIIMSISHSFFEKEKEGYGFEPIRIAEKACYLAILEGGDTLLNKIVSSFAYKDYWKRYVEKYPQHKDLLFKELLHLMPEEESYSFPFSARRRVLSKLSREEIQRFVERLKKTMKAEGLETKAD